MADPPTFIADVSAFSSGRAGNPNLACPRKKETAPGNTRGLNAELELQTAELLRLSRKPLTWLTFEKGRRWIARLQRKSAPFRARAGSEICSRDFLLCGTYPLGGAFVFSASDHAQSSWTPHTGCGPIFLSEEDNMNTRDVGIRLIAR